MAAKPQYDLHPGIKMVQDWVASLKAKTGRSVEEWIAHLRKAGPKDERSRREWLKTEHGLGTNAAWWIAERAGPEGKAKAEEDTPEGYLKAAVCHVEEQYAGKKVALRPLYDELLKLGRAMGKDVRACPCKTMVPLYRRHVFAQIKPTTNTRVDLGLALAKHAGKLPARLIDTGGKEKKDRITHRIPISSPKEIDADVRRWLKAAYDLDAP
jgi:hypothetical protein